MSYFESHFSSHIRMSCLNSDYRCVDHPLQAGAATRNPRGSQGMAQSLYLLVQRPFDEPRVREFRHRTLEGVV